MSEALKELLITGWYILGAFLFIALIIGVISVIEPSKITSEVVLGIYNCKDGSYELVDSCDRSNWNTDWDPTIIVTTEQEVFPGLCYELHDIQKGDSVRFKAWTGLICEGTGKPSGWD